MAGEPIAAKSSPSNAKIVSGLASAESIGQSTTKVGVAPGPRETKLGRPRLEDRDKTIEARKPWLVLKMSRATWYRRQAEKRARPAAE